MSFTVNCYDGYRHNRYLFEKVVPLGCRKARLQQTVQGPLAPEHFELNDDEVTPIWTFVFRNGAITSKKKSYIVPHKKLYLSPDGPTRNRDWDYIIMEPRTKNPTVLDYKSYAYEGCVEAYLPGGIVRSYSDSEENAFRIRNEFLRERAAGFSTRII